MPSLTTGLSLRLPSFIFSSAPHLCIQWSSSVRLTRKPDGFEAPVLIPWKDKIAYKFIVDGRWMTNDTEPTEIDHGFVNNVYTAPPKPPSLAPHLDSTPPSHRSESEVESEHAEKVPVDADKPVANGSALDEPHEVPTPIVEPSPEEPSTIPKPEPEEAKAVITPTVEAAHVAFAQVALDPQEVERASDEVRLNPDLSKPDKDIFDQIQLSPEPQAPKEPVTNEIPTEVTPTAVENGVSTSEAEPPKEETLTAGEGVKVAAGPEPTPAPEPEPDSEPEPAIPVIEPVPEPANVEGAPTATETEVVPAPEREAATVHESSKPAPFLAPSLAVEQEPATAEKAIPAAEPTVDGTPGPEPNTKSSDAPSSPLPTAPAINGHTKSMSTASTSTAVPSLPTTATRKVSRKFSLLGRDKSRDSSPTGSSRFSSQPRREKRHSLLGKLKELFGDKEKKEKEKSVKA